MKRALLAGLAAGLLATATPMTQMAHADPDWHYRGGCTFETVNDSLPTGPLGGQDQWTGEATGVFVATSHGSNAPQDVPISFECTLWRNGSTNLGTILGDAGTTIAADTDATFTFTAGETDTIQVCQEVTVGFPNSNKHGNAAIFNPAWCFDSERTPIVPEPVTEALLMLLDLLDGLVLGPVTDILNEHVFEPTDFITCFVLAAIGPIVNGLNMPDVIRIDTDAAGGPDLWILDVEFWSCPDYAT